MATYTYSNLSHQAAIELDSSAIILLENQPCAHHPGVHDQLKHARLVVTGLARDADDAREILLMTGLLLDEP